MSVQFTPRRSRHSPRFPNSIRQYRIKAGLSQRQLGTALGLGPDFVSLWERGLRLPTFPRIVGLARELGTAPQALYEDVFATRLSQEGTQNNPSAA